MKYCKDCENFQAAFWEDASPYPVCRKAPEQTVISVVYGPLRRVIRVNCTDARAPEGLCGPDATLFTPKKPQPRKWWQLRAAR
jgi:hypothetical protein